MGTLTRYSHTVAAGLLGLAVLVGLYALGQRLDWRWDLTRGKLHSLSDQTGQVLDGLDSDVSVVAFFRPAEPGREGLEDLLELYASRSGKVGFEIVDPDRAPHRAREMDIVQTGEVAVVSGGKSEKLYMPDEEKLTNAFIRVTDRDTAQVRLTTGHGELSMNPSPSGTGGATILVQAVERQGAEVRELALLGPDGVPAGTDAVLILGPRKDFLPDELAKLNAYLSAGGRVLYAADAESRVNVDAWAARSGIHREPGLVLDPLGKAVTDNYLAPVVQDYPSAPFTKGFNLMTVFPTASALRRTEGSGLEIRAAALTSAGSWLVEDVARLEKGKAAFDPETDIRGPLWLAAYFEGTGGDNSTAPRLVVFADQHFLSDQYIGLLGNLDLARNTVNWLMAKDNLITVTKPEGAGALLFPARGQSFFLMWVPLAVLPGLTLLLGVAVMAKRRMKGRAASGGEASG